MQEFAWGTRTRSVNFRRMTSGDWYIRCFIGHDASKNEQWEEKQTSDVQCTFYILPTLIPQNLPKCRQIGQPHGSHLGTCYLRPPREKDDDSIDSILYAAGIRQKYSLKAAQTSQKAGSPYRSVSLTPFGANGLCTQLRLNANRASEMSLRGSGQVRTWMISRITEN